MSVQGFWGLQLVPGKTYSQVVAAPFRISMASLTADADGNKRTSVSVLIDDKEFILCTLVPNKIEQQPLDITFVEGEEVTFSAKGSNAIHLTGNYVFHDDDEGDMGSIGDESEEEDNVEEFLKKLPPNATKEDINKALIASINGDLDDESDEEIDSDEAMGEDEFEEEEEESEDDEDYEEEKKPAAANKKRPAEDVKTPPTKKQKAAEQAKKAETKKEEAKKEQAKKAEPKKEEPKKEQAKKEEPKKEEQKKEQAKKEEPKKKEEQKKEEPKKKVTKLPNGLIIEDIKIGEGASCKSGQRVGMRYIGKLTNGKVFDKNVSGKPFSFLLGRGEVIKGWDLGIVGMKAGGERRLTIPAPLAYGKRGAPPDIPKNATLIFDVKLLTMK